VEQPLLKVRDDQNSLVRVVRSRSGLLLAIFPIFSDKEHLPSTGRGGV
jgi:hypothetical protein